MGIQNAFKKASLHLGRNGLCSIWAQLRCLLAPYLSRKNILFCSSERSCLDTERCFLWTNLAKGRVGLLPAGTSVCHKAVGLWDSAVRWLLHHYTQICLQKCLLEYGPGRGNNVGPSATKSSACMGRALPGPQWCSPWLEELRREWTGPDALETQLALSPSQAVGTPQVFASYAFCSLLSWIVTPQADLKNCDNKMRRQEDLLNNLSLNGAALIRQHTRLKKTSTCWKINPTECSASCLSH